MTEPPSGTVPEGFGEADRQAMRDFWEVYDAHYEQVGEELKAWLDRDPHFAPMFGDMPDEQWAERQRQSRQLLHQAIVEGDWEPYLEDLRTQGKEYAAANLGFGALFDLVGAFRPYVTPHLVSAYGDDTEDLLSAINGMDGFLDTAMATIGEAYLVSKEETIREQQDALRELSTPVLKIRESRLILPIVGLLDSQRAQQLTDQLLEAIRVNRAKAVVVDITGVAAVDSEVANHLLQTVDACKLMGADVVVTGLSPEIAQTLVSLGIDLGRMKTVGDLQGGIEEVDRVLGDRIVREDEREVLSQRKQGVE